jgi:hypothetical protein
MCMQNIKGSDLPEPLVNNGYANHLHEEFAMFKIEDFVAQTHVQSKCHL